MASAEHRHDGRPDARQRVDLDALVAERFGSINAVARERGRRPPPVRAAGRRAPGDLVDDDVTIARRRRILERALEPAPDASTTGRQRRRRVA